MPSPDAPIVHAHDPAIARGVVQLATQATVAVTDIVEAMHQAVWSTLGVAGAGPGRTGGLSGRIYRAVRVVANLAGPALEQALHALPAGRAPLDGTPPAGTRSGALIGALNGVIGDRLAALGNPLALTMHLCDEAGRVVDAGHVPVPANGRVVVLLHGLCMHDSHWRTPLGDHGAALGTALEACVLRLRYNSGLAVADNGAVLSRLLEDLVARAPSPVRRLVLVGHSMGGLVARSAAWHAEGAGARWRARLAAMVFLGTPHHGAPLERIGLRVQQVLELNRFSAALLPVARLRSAGITDLRHGNVRAEHAAQDRFATARDRRSPLPLPRGVACFAVAGSLAARRGVLADRLLGDGLVPLPSALGRHRRPEHQLHFDARAQWTAWRTGHLELLQSARVRRRLVQWLQPLAAGWHDRAAAPACRRERPEPETGGPGKALARCASAPSRLANP